MHRPCPRPRERRIGRPLAGMLQWRCEARSEVLDVTTPLGVGTVLTYDDYRALPEDGKRYELLGGRLVLAPAPAPSHQTVLINLLNLLYTHVMREGLGRLFVAPIDVVLDFTDVVQPDILFLSNERLPLITSQNIAGGPDLVVEILSPSTAERDRGEKFDLYARRGVDHYWILDPSSRTLEAYRLKEAHYELDIQLEGDARFTPALFPGLTINLAKVWR